MGTSAARTNETRMRRATLLPINDSLRAMSRAYSEIRGKSEETAVACHDDIVHTVLLGNLRLGDAILAHAVQVVVRVNRVQFMIFSYFAFYPVSAINDV